MKITKVIGFALSSPYGNGKILGQPLGVKSVGFVEVHTDAGLVGLGETYAGVYTPELIDPVTQFLSSRVVGLDPLKPEDVAQKAFIPFISRNGLFCSVYSALDIALWDIKGQVEGQPIHQLLNPHSSHSVPQYASGGSAAMSPDEVFADATKACERGFRAFKMRVGVSEWKTDLLRVAAAREALGNDRALMIDAIMGTISPPWSVDIACKRIKDLVAFNPVWLEEPLHPDDMINLKKLRGVTNIAIAAGEALTGHLDFSSYLSTGAVDMIQVDPTHCGGITIGRKIIELADAHNIPVAMHVWGSSAAQLANAHLAFSHSRVKWLEVPMVSFELSSSMTASAIEQNNSEFGIKPEASGLGAKLNDQIKDRFQLVRGSGYKL